ncbi:hypothetical protein N0K08_15200 [Acidovorax sp. Be4]|uniref:DUF2486 family protein n=1 Tax=Acidovorax bellezanensis TaxID=2976702 RepID=A0ABT2PND5_9BURK|nr:hypothetical protein [Acidovorax sp. Be4]MCT9811992.1 hypothetical protein [Acidovorax sp. Be4]
MDSPQAKVPPRYVPTLTEVVTGLEPVAPEAWVAQAAPELPAAAPLEAAPAVLFEAPAVPTAADMAVVEEQLVQRLLQRVELALDQRLQACIAQVVQEQTRSITLRLQEELESVVRQTVHDAVAQELEQSAPR